MFLRSLILRGFKTFADTTELEFPNDARITAIVGPNGCGKSNLMDATRWVLGEDNPRELRVAGLSNIIFAGTAARRAVSMAEVTMVFDNSAGKLPVSFSEIAIKRRTFREGESEFYINKNRCRLKDIKDLLLDTGLGEGTYSIITQGQVDAILSSKGDERRAVFEEAAGINKYKFRKVAAEKKLISAEQNILRINDLKIEVAENLITLEEQSRKAKEYLNVRDNVKELDIGLCKRLLANIVEKRSLLQADLEKIKETSQAKKEVEQKDLTELTTLKEKHQQLEREIDEIIVKLDHEKDQLRDLELDRRFAESEFKREERTLEEIGERDKSLREKVEEIKLLLLQEKEGIDLSQTPFATLLGEIVKQINQLAGFLSESIATLGQENSISLNLGHSIEKEEANKLKIEMLEDELIKIGQEKERLRFALQAQKSQLENLQTKNNEAQGKRLPLDLLSQKKQVKENLTKTINGLEEKIRSEDMVERQSISAEATVEIALAKIDSETTAIAERLYLEYNLNIEDLESQPYEISNVSKAKSEVEQGKRKLSELEPVNLLAIDEFEKAKERLAFIEAQLADLNAARGNLHSLITELNLRAEETFIQTMSQISKVFSETFASLFAGGEAKISLAQGSSALDAEIEISVRPSGRKWLPLPLLSGGERALSAIAILFSLLKIRPSPFCFLDEVDAALDDANIGRFANMLKTFSEHSQIIVITHNKRTMAVADNIYGVTMQDPGISQILSMELAKTAQ